MSSQMKHPDDPQNLLACADGELDRQGRQRVLEQMVGDGDMARQIVGQQQLRQAAAGAMDDPKLTAPADLRARLRELAASVESDNRPAAGRPPVLARLGRWISAAVAAVLLIAALGVFFAAIEQPGNVAAGSIIPAAQMDMFASRHVACSRSLMPLMVDQTLPQDIKALPAALSQRLGYPTAGLDLSGIGYRFDRVGPCTVLGKGAVHLIYQAVADSGHTDSISLWIMPIAA
jgi:hypothetical protein